MIRKENRYDGFAYAVAHREVDSSVTALDEGQWITIQGGKVVISDGSQKSFICTSSRRDGRDFIKGVPVKKAAYLLGAFELSVSNFDPAGTYGDMTPLVVMAGGILTPFISGTHEDRQIVAYSLNAPVNGYLRICSNQ